MRWLDLSDFDTEENINATRGDKNMKKFIKASDGSEMVNMLYDLTQSMWFEPIDKFSEVVYNADEIIPVIDLDDCVEFGTNNGQELLIYDEVNGRKHIKYSCSMTTIFDELVITDVWDKNGQVYECDYDAIYDELAEKNNFNGVESSTQRRGGKNMKKFVKANNGVPFGKKTAQKQAIKAYDFEGLDEDEIMDAEYEIIENAVDAVNKLSAWVDAIKAGIEEYKQDWSPWGGETSEWEMFGGPDDTEAFTNSVYDITSELEKLSRTLGDVLNVYIYPEGV